MTGVQVFTPVMPQENGDARTNHERILGLKLL